MILLKNLLLEVTKESVAEKFLSNLVRGTEWEDHVFIAGGYVRDQLLGSDANDIDLVVSLPDGGIKFAEWVTKKVGNYKAGSNPCIFPKFGTAKLTLNGVTYDGVDLSEVDVEVVMTRSEKYTSGSRKPDVAFGDLKADVERRDATVNSLLKKLSSGEILDLTGKGKDDLQNGILRTPLDPDETFKDDPLRILRMVRMSAKYNWKLPMFMLRSIRKNAASLKNISRERIHDEVNKMLLTNNAGKAMRLLKALKLAPFVFPSLDRIADADLAAIGTRPKDLPIRLAALFVTLPEAGKTAEVEMRNTKYDTATIQMVKMILDNYRTLSDDPDGPIKIRELVASLGENKTMQLARFLFGDAENPSTNIIRQQAQFLRDNPLPISGQDLIDMGMKPGPKFSEILSVVRKVYLSDPKTPKDQYIQVIKSHL